jgi:hypothetical protein
MEIQRLIAEAAPAQHRRRNLASEVYDVITVIHRNWCMRDAPDVAGNNPASPLGGKHMGSTLSTVGELEQGLGEHQTENHHTRTSFCWRPCAKNAFE